MAIPDNTTNSNQDGTVRICSEQMQDYFSKLQSEMVRTYKIAGEARDKGYDPSLEPEIPPAEDLAARVEELVGPKGIAPRIRELTKKFSDKSGAREIVSLEVAREIARRMIQGDSRQAKERAMDQAIRTGLAILTEGILVAPLEGVADVKVGLNGDGTDYVAVYYAGPIRSAGGTGQALSILIADVVRRDIGIDRYKPTESEVNRYKEEIPLYSQVQRSLQYKPSASEIDLIVRNCPVCIHGEGTEKEEVSGYRDLPRIETNRLRGGMALVLSEGLCLKAKKIQKHVKNLNIEGWEFIDDYINGVKSSVPSKPQIVDAPMTPDSPEPLNTDPDGEEIDPDKAEDEPLKDYNEPDNDDVNDTDEPKGKCSTANEHNTDFEVIIKPEIKYLKDLPAGRPVLAHPSRPGGFRLRYGRTRTTGLAAIAIHPAAMVLLDSFPAVGTQVKIERPGKAGVITPCDSIEGPIALMHSGDLVELNSIDELNSLETEVKSIIDCGEVLIPFGEFVENNHRLMPGAYCLEWWLQELGEARGELICAPGSCSDEDSGAGTQQAFPSLQDVRDLRGSSEHADSGKSYGSDIPSAKSAFDISEEHELPLHPYYNLFWHDLNLEQLKILRDYILEQGKLENSDLILMANEDIKNILVMLGALHIDKKDTYVIGDRYSYVILRCLGIDENFEAVKEWPDESQVNFSDNTKRGPTPYHSKTLDYVSMFSGIKIKPRAPNRVGMRIGRPEKAKERIMSPQVHALFPIGQAGGSQRLVNDACTKQQIEIEVGMRRCSRCNQVSFQSKCKCGGHTEPTGEIKKLPIRFGDYCLSVRVALGEDKLPPMKAVIGLISKEKTPEALEKGLLRAKHKLSVFKDGTIRFDMTDVPLSHFKPQEIGTSIEKLQEMGYCYDIWGEPLTSDDQVLELKVQDVVPSISCGKYFVKAANFIDELLVKFYKLDSFYNVNSHQDIIGHLVIGLAPHTSGGVLSRIIGFTTANVGFAHPYYHAAKRRNCDGDEDCIMLLMDALLNFSKSFLPKSRGGQMDAPLVLTTQIEPSEIDKEAQNVDVSPIYPLAFYQATERFAHPKDVQHLIELAGERLGREEQYEGLNFTHDTSDINAGPKNSTYKVLDKMTEKMDAQLNLAKLIRCVDVRDVASRVINNHFLKDMVGNLKKFSTQKFRCTKCNRKYQRIPLRGVCTNTVTEVGNGGRKNICGGNITMTVHEGSVKKYLESSKSISEKYDIPKYTRQRIELIENAINSVFENDKVKKCTIEDFL